MSPQTFDVSKQSDHNQTYTILLWILM